MRQKGRRGLRANRGRKAIQEWRDRQDPRGIRETLGRPDRRVIQEWRVQRDPRGDTGDAGPAGPMGLQGATGPAGPNTGSVFTRWGNGTAPAGTTLVYAGFAHGDYYSHSGRGEPIVIPEHTADPNGPGVTSTALLYPVIVRADAAAMPSGITANRYLKAAVCYAPGPTTILWGSWTAPAGWSILYKGYAFGANYQQEGGFAPLVVDADNFDASPDATGQLGSLIYPTQLLGNQPPGSTNTTNRFLRCAVIVRDPPAD